MDKETLSWILIYFTLYELLNDKRSSQEASQAINGSNSESKVFQLLPGAKRMSLIATTTQAALILKTSNNLELGPRPETSIASAAWRWLRFLCFHLICSRTGAKGSRSCMTKLVIRYQRNHILTKPRQQLWRKLHRCIQILEGWQI